MELNAQNQPNQPIQSSSPEQTPPLAQDKKPSPAWLVILLLLLFPPVGFFLMYLDRKYYSWFVLAVAVMVYAFVLRSKIRSEGPNSKKWALSAFIVILVFYFSIPIGPLLTITPVYSLINQIGSVSQNPQTTLTPTPDPTANWKTYTSDFGFELKYPSQMQSSSSANQVSFYQGENTICCGYEGPNLNVTIDNPAGLNQSPSDTLGSFKIGGQNVTKLSGLAGVRIGPIESGGHEFVFHVYGKDKTDKDFGEIYQILSTFKFTDQSQANAKNSTTSPDGAYIVSLIPPSAGDALPKITIKDGQGKVLSDDIVAPNFDKVMNNGGGQSSWALGQWRNNTTLHLVISLASGDTIEVDLDVTTGNLIESTFTRTRVRNN
jgi:hypothetical protein